MSHDNFDAVATRLRLDTADAVETLGSHFWAVRWRAARVLDDYAYVRVGTGMGVGFVLKVWR